MVVTALLLFSILSPQVSDWITSERSARKVWVDWQRDNVIYQNFLVHLYGGRMRTRSHLLNSSSYFAPPRAIRAVLPYARSVEFVPSLRAMLRRDEIYRVKDFDYGDAKSSLDIVKIPEVHKMGFVGSGVRISLLDVGVDSSHPAVRHIFRRDGVVATHDFNSGDHLKLYHNSQVFDVPFVNHGPIRYINSFSVSGDSSRLIVVYSQTPAESLTNSYLYGKWSLGMTVGYLSNGVISGWDTITVAGYGTLKNFPSVDIRNDSLFVSWQEFNTEFKVKFEVVDLTQWPPSISTPIELSPRGFSPLTLASDTLISVFWIDTTRGIVRRYSSDGGQTFSSENVLISARGAPGGLTGMTSNNWLYVAGAVGDSTHLFAIDSTGTTIPIQTLSGILPSLAKTGTDSIRLTVVRGDRVLAFTISSRLVVDSTEVCESPFVYSTFDDGNTIFIADERLIGYPGEVVDSEFIDFVSGFGDFVVFRKRGDEDISPDPEDPTSHGTKMLSIIGGFLEGSIVGGAPGADYIIAKTEKVFTSGLNFENVIEEDFWVEAMEWSIRHGARILSSSLGYRYFNRRDWYGDSLMNGQFAHSSRAASQAAEHNLVVIASMGNVSHAFLPDPEVGDTSLTAPADASEILSIGGIASPDSVEKNCGFGPTADGRIKPDIVAPYRISWPDTDGTVYIIGGTSISAAIVAGGIGAVLEAHPSWDAFKIIRYAKETARQLEGLPDSNNLSGYGIFDALSLINMEPLEKTPPGDRDRILSVYPNPVRGSRNLHIKFLSFHTGKTVIRIYTLDGMLITKQSAGCSGIGMNEFQVRLPDNISPGTYIILLKTGFSAVKSMFSVVK